jgi:hypothetical protein
MGIGVDKSLSSWLSSESTTGAEENQNAFLAGKSLGETEQFFYVAEM